MTCDRPLIVVDVETTGPDPDLARIVQIAVLQIKTDGTVKEWSALVDPGVPIPPEATKIHGITDAQVADAQSFGAFAANLAKGFTGCAFAGYNVRYDLKVLKAEMARCGVEWDYAQAPVLDALRFWQMLEPRTLSDAARHFLGAPHTGAHDALADIRITRDILAVQIGRMGLGAGAGAIDTQALHDKAFPAPVVPANAADGVGKVLREGDTLVLSFGKHKGKSLVSLAADTKTRGYLRWMLDDPGFAPATKALVREAL